MSHTHPYGTDNFFHELYEKAISQENLLSCPPENITALRDQKRNRLREILKLSKLYEMQTLVCQPSGSELRSFGTVLQYDFTFLKGLTAPLWCIKPHTPNGKNIIYCHGHGKHGARESFTDFNEEQPYHRFLPIDLASRGYRVLIPELPGFGECKYYGYKQEDQQGCYSNTALLHLFGLNIAGLRVFEIISLMDYFRDLTFSVFGVSGGGLVSGFLSAVDDRPEKTVVSCFGAAFHTSIMAMHHCMDNYTSDLLSIGECGEILALCAPKPLLLSLGKNDRIFPISGSRETADYLEKVYRRMGAADHFQKEFFEGGHQISKDILFDFLN